MKKWNQKKENNSTAVQLKAPIKVFGLKMVSVITSKAYVEENTHLKSADLKYAEIELSNAHQWNSYF